MKKIINYKLNDMELAEYTRIFPKLTGINNCLYVDECSSFERWKHPLWVIISNGDPYIDCWVALSISEIPEIIAVGNGFKYDVSTIDMNKCKLFISKLHSILFDIAMETVDSDILYDLLSKCDWMTLTSKDISNIQHNFYEKYSLFDANTDYNFPLAEMSILRPKDTKLNFCIWIEPNGRTTEHKGERIKFQDSNSTISTAFYPIRLTASGAELGDCKTPCKASSKVQKQAIEFVNKYREIIEAFINHNLDENNLKDAIRKGITSLDIYNEIQKKENK